MLLTDGQNNTGPDPLDAADQAANRGVRVFTVGVGTNRGDIVGLEGRSFRVQLDEEDAQEDRPEHGCAATTRRRTRATW